MVKTNEKLSAARRESHGCSSVSSSSTLLSSFLEVGHGSRFWTLVDNVSSDDDSSSSDMDFSVGEVVVSIGGSTSARAVLPLSPWAQVEPAGGDDRACAPSVPEGPGPITAGMTGKLLVSHPNLVWQQGKAGEPRKGPLPLARAARTWSLGDL
jgi:hypothetical protein